ncbi:MULTISPECIES: ABC transporter permease [Brevibacillus]|uniref:ABC transporter permease n=1 Tax=Brevibacillus invocatus TaxID=173959 RepID=A0A3M8CEC4_9BACL|nr:MULTISPECIES: ABC transporter permease [Brevibacillus]MDH4617389.1 ABC transporter permease [Brevibacillus sp. AY1]RNB74116.1 ABC transporter permease [Brevibacillus invocatus]
MTFRQFAFNNVSRNKRTYAAFFLSSVFSVMIFFVYAMFIFHPGIADEAIHESVATGMMVAEYVIFLFAFFFLFYCVGAFLKKREKEFGILFMHGMTPLQRNLLIFMENMLIGVVSILFGIVLGMVLAKLFFQFAGFLLDVQALPFYWAWKAIGLTAVAFLVLFAAISVFTVLFLRKRSLLELLQGSQRPKKEPKASVSLSVLAAMLLGLSYLLALTAEGIYVPVLLMPVTAMTIGGTYLLFTQLSVFAIGMMKKKRFFYWKRTNLLTLSDMAYRMKDNARMFFLVSIVSTIAFCAIGTLAALAGSIQETVVRTNPFAFEYQSKRDNAEEQKHLSMLENRLEQAGYTYEKHMLKMRVLPNEVEGEQVGVVKLAQYNQFALAANADSITVGDQEAFLFVRWFGDSIESSTLHVGDSILRVKSNASVIPLASGLGFERLAVVPDAVYDQLEELEEESLYGYNVPKWKETKEISLNLEEKIGRWDEEGKYYFSTRAPVYYSMKQMANTALFIGLFVGVLFFVAAASFLYFRLYTDLENDKRQYGAISKIGMTESELTRIVTIQIALLFFVPILVAIAHSIVAFVSLQSFLKLMLITSVVKPTAIVLLSFVVVQAIYFWIIRNRYLFHLKRSVF